MDKPCRAASVSSDAARLAGRVCLPPDYSHALIGVSAGLSLGEARPAHADHTPAGTQIIAAHGSGSTALGVARPGLGSLSQACVVLPRSDAPAV